MDGPEANVLLFQLLQEVLLFTGREGDDPAL